MSDDGDSLMEVARRGLTTTVGVGVLLFQNVQVQRRELAKAAPRALAELGEVVHQVVREVRSFATGDAEPAEPAEHAEPAEPAEHAEQPD
jgi:hypothetical protein